MRAPIAYIRRSSKSRSDPGDISREFQTETVRALAGGDANLVILDGDWGKSAATEETDKRLAFRDLMARVERGEVSTLYAYSTDRLARSVQWAARLLDACEVAGTTIVTGEGRFAPGDDMARTLFQFQAIQNEGYSRQQKRKRRSTLERQRARGDKLGQPYYGGMPGEDVGAVMAAFDEVGSYRGAARLLNARGVPSRRGHWGHVSVRVIVNRQLARPILTVRGAKPRADHTFYRLLRCHCGHTLTGSKRSDGSSIYRCIRAETDVGHGKQSVAEGPIRRWAEVEVARLRPPAAFTMEDADEEAAALRARLERLKDLYVTGDIDRERYDAEKGTLEATLTRLDLASMVVEVPTFSWDHEPRDLNLALRALWEYVELGPDLRPVRAQWLVPDSWLAEPTPGSPPAPPG